jgi:hypothetical protein
MGQQDRQLWIERIARALAELKKGPPAERIAPSPADAPDPQPPRAEGK